MKKTIAAVIIPLLILSFSGLTSCNSCKNRSDKNDNRIMKEQKNMLETQIEKNVYPLPTSAEVIKMLTDLQVGYNLGISNDVDNAKKYYTSAARSINLGVYGADLSYATLYNMDQKVIDYMDAIRTIANDLNMTKIYNAPLYDSIKKNFDNKNKLVKILTGAFDDTYAYMSDNDQQILALLVVGGAWVEGMYLTCNVNEAAYSVYGISKVLIEQKKSFDLFLDVTKPYVEDPILADFIKTLEPIRNVYAGLTTSLTDQNIKDITAAMTIIRAKIVTP
jgi:hypothetical protein